MESAGRGLRTVLRNQDDDAVGLISSCFVSSSRGAFCSNLSTGYLTAKASVFDLKSGKEQIIAEWANSTCKRRSEADKCFREWLEKENIKEKLIQAALVFQTTTA